MKQPILQATGISVCRNGRQLLQPIDFTLTRGETVGIYGPNGAGKSTFLQALAGLIPLASGTLNIEGKVLGQDLDLLGYHRRIAAVFQEPLLLRGTVSQNVGMGLLLRGVGAAERDERVNSILALLKIAHLADRPVGNLSGGEAQRASLARALVLEPDVLFLDEPFAALDQPSRRRLIPEISEILSSGNIATLFITHDLAETLAVCSRCLIIDVGQVLQDDQPRQIVARPATARVAEIVGVDTIHGVPVAKRHAMSAPA